MFTGSTEVARILQQTLARRLGKDGLEQLFTFDQLPQRGDLALAIRVATSTRSRSATRASSSPSPSTASTQPTDASAVAQARCASARPNRAPSRGR